MTGRRVSRPHSGRVRQSKLCDTVHPLRRGGATRQAPIRGAGALPATKFALPPEQPATVVRGRLHEALDEGTQRALTLVSAPPGAGKTVLLGSWIAAGGPPGPVAWLSLDPADADRRRFWRAVLEALASRGRRRGRGGARRPPAGPRRPPDVGADHGTGRARRARRARARRLPRGRRGGPRRPRPDPEPPAARPPGRDRHARRPAAAAREAAAARPADRDPRAVAGADLRGDPADAGAGRRVARRAARPPPVGPHGGLGRRAPARRAVAARPPGSRLASSTSSPATTARSATT